MSDERRNEGWGRHRRNRRIALAGLPLVLLAAVLGIFLFGWGVSEGDIGGTGSDPPPIATEAARTEGDDSSQKEDDAPQGNDSLERQLPQPPRGSCDDPLVLVDKEHPLPPSYAPGGLVSLSAYGVPTVGGDHLLKEEAARHLPAMIEDARRENIELVVASAYRSYADQRASYQRWSQYYGSADAGGVSAKPGQSEHQLGTTVDFTNAKTGYEVHQRFGKTRAANWLEQNAWRYGFALSYPEGKTGQTGYLWEPWHFRYIGRENARDWHESGDILFEYLHRHGVRCG